MHDLMAEKHWYFLPESTVFYSPMEKSIKACFFAIAKSIKDYSLK